MAGWFASFWQLFACRAVVGIGEAAFGPAARSLVADYYPARAGRRRWACSRPASPSAGCSASCLGGMLEQLYGWRVAFMVVGVPGFLLALLASRLRRSTRGAGGPVPRAAVREREEGLVTRCSQFYSADPERR